MVQSISLMTTELAYSLSVLISDMLLTPWYCGGQFSNYLHSPLNDRFAEQDMILENNATIDSNY